MTCRRDGRSFIVIATVLPLLSVGALAQDSTQGPATPATKLGGGGGAAGDPNGAIRALGSASGENGKQTVTLPSVDKSGSARNGGEPAGTTGSTR